MGPIFAVMLASVLNKVRQPAMRGGVIAGAAMATRVSCRYSQSPIRRATGRGAVALRPGRSFGRLFVPIGPARRLTFDLSLRIRRQGQRLTLSGPRVLRRIRGPPRFRTSTP
jgi:hypothetical protein